MKRNAFQTELSPSTPILLKLASNTAWLFLERVVSVAVAIGVGLYFGRYLGPENYGLYSYALGLYAIFATLSKLGINALVVNQTVQSEKREPAILGSVFAIRMAASVTFLLMLNAAGYFLMERGITREITLVFSLALLFGPFETITHWFEARVMMKPPAVARSLVSLLTGAGRLALILMGVSLFWFAWLIPLEALLTGALLVYAYHQQGLKVSTWKPDRNLMSGFIREGAPLFLSVLAVVTYMKIDKVMLGKLSSPREVGLYSAAVGISEMFYFIPVVMAGPLFPYLIKANKRGEGLFRQTLQLMCDGFVWIALLIAVLLSLFSGPVIALAYGQEYLASSRILALHIWAGPFVFLEALRVKWFVIQQNTRFHFTTTAVGALSNIVLNFIFIPLYQGYGAAIATILSYSIATVFSCFLFRETRTIGVVMVKAVLAPLRILATLRAFAAVRAVVDGDQPAKIPTNG